MERNDRVGDILTLEVTWLKLAKEKKKDSWTTSQEDRKKAKISLEEEGED